MYPIATALGINQQAYSVMVDHMIALLAIRDDIIMIMIKIPGKAISLPNQHIIYTNLDKIKYTAKKVFIC